ncbi:MAG: glycosyltransferase [Desulfurivibrionaceae bacterium]
MNIPGQPQPPRFSPRSDNSESFADLAIVVAVKNGANTISECLASVFWPLANGAKLYVFDALSSDNTRDIVLDHCPQAHYTCENDSGLYFAWNNAVKTVGESFVYFINCDDSLYSSENLQTLISALRADDRLVAASGKTLMTRQDGVERFAGKPMLRDWFAFDMPIITPATVFSVAALRSIGGFSTAYRISSDYDMLLRLLKRYKHGAFVFHDLVITRFSLGGMSNNHRSYAFREIRAIIATNLALWQFVVHMLWYVWNESKRQLLLGYFVLRARR